MIKINLANSFGKTSPAVSMSALSGGDEQKTLIVKVVIILVPLVLLYFYESSQIETLNQQVTQLRAKSMEMDTQLEKLKTVEATVVEIEKQKKELEEKLGVVESIFGLRNAKLQAITALQEAIPDELWLEKISYSGRKGEIVGYAPNLELSQRYLEMIAVNKAIFTGVSSKTLKQVQLGNSKYYKFDIELEVRN